MSTQQKKVFVFFDRDKRNIPSAMLNDHVHAHNELYYLVNGKTKYFIGSELYFLQPGDLIFIPKGEYHRTDNLDAKNVERILLNFEDDFIRSEHLQLLNEVRHFRLQDNQRHQIARLFRKIEEESRERLLGYREMQRLYLQKMIILMSRYRQDISDYTPNSTYQRIQSATRYIQTNYTQDLSLDILAKMYSTSPGHFSKQFKQVTGVRVGVYITMTRISVAQELLSSGKIPITEVALKCGYNDSNYFTRKFKEITGTTPKKYSQQYGSFK